MTSFTEFFFQALWPFYKESFSDVNSLLSLFKLEKGFDHFDGDGQSLFSVVAES